MLEFFCRIVDITRENTFNYGAFCIFMPKCPSIALVSLYCSSIGETSYLRTNFCSSSSTIELNSSLGTKLGSSSIARLGHAQTLMIDKYTR